MFVGEVILAIVAYPIILLAPGLLWTFLFKSISSRMGIIKRIVISALISISSIPLILFSLNSFLDVQIDFFSTLIAILSIFLLPFLISFLSQYLFSKRDLQEPTGMINDLKEFIMFSIQELKKVPASQHHLILLGILALGIILTLMPHFGYGLPIHTDEWHYMAYADNLISPESPVMVVPYYGHSINHWEIGFIMFIAFIKVASGVSWPFLFYTLPAVLFSLTILASYLIGKRYGFGLHSAFLVALAPSTLRFLGPVFLVPITLGILLFMISIYLIIAHKNKLKYPLVFLVLAFTFLMHPPSGGYLFIALFAVFLVNIIKKQKQDFILLGILLLVFTIGVFFIPQSKMEGFTWSSLTSSSYFFLPLFGFFDFLDLANYIPAILAIIGCGYLYQQKDKYSQSLISIFILIVLFATSLYYLYPRFYNIQAVYDRAIILLIIIVSLIAGAGLLMVQKNVSKPMFIVLISCILALSIASHINEPYYNIITESEYEDFIWVRDNLNESYGRAILDPWKAVAFTPVTGKQVYYRYPQGPDSRLEDALETIGNFFSDGCVDTVFLEDNGISIVYTHGHCLNPDLLEVRPGIYVLNYSS